jgi:hypothetical protein
MRGRFGTLALLMAGSQLSCVCDVEDGGSGCIDGVEESMVRLQSAMA